MENDVDDISAVNLEVLEEIVTSDHDASVSTETLQDAWKIIVTMTHRLKHFEMWHQQRLNARNRGEYIVCTRTDVCAILQLCFLVFCVFI